MASIGKPIRRNVAAFLIVLILIQIVVSTSFDDYDDLANKYCINDAQEEASLSQCFTSNREDTGLCSDVSDYESCGKVLSLMDNGSTLKLDLTENSIRIGKDGYRICYLPDAENSVEDQASFNKLRAVEILFDVFSTDSLYKPIDTVNPLCFYPRGVESREQLRRTVCCTRFSRDIQKRALYVSVSARSYPYDRVAAPSANIWIWLSDLLTIDLSQYELSKFVGETPSGSTSTSTPEQPEINNNEILGTVLGITLPTVFGVLIVAMWITRKQKWGLFFGYFRMESLATQVVSENSIDSI